MANAVIEALSFIMLDVPTSQGEIMTTDRSRPRSHPRHCIVPPYILDSIVRRGTDAQRASAMATLAHDKVLRERRLIAGASAPTAAPTEAPTETEQDPQEGKCDETP
jgi:hypothetical protein